MRNPRDAVLGSGKAMRSTPYRQAPFNAAGVPCLLRLGPGGTVEASLTEGELTTGNAVDVLLGLAPDHPRS